MHLGGLRIDEEPLSEATPRFLVNVADKGLTAPVSSLDATLTSSIRKH
jgi:hypothetical protein